MRLSSLLLFIFPFILRIDDTFSLWKNSKDTLDTYVIDILFSNGLTIIRCNPYERQILRDITIETVGHIKCSNSDLFLPENHIQDITLLQWNFTAVKCDKKKKTIEEERTYFYIKHKAKNAFKKSNFDLIRVGSTGPSKSKMDEKKFQLSFQHPPRNLDMTLADQSNETFATEIYSFKHRPILCQEKQLAAGGPCANLHQNLTYICYYKMGVAEPPTITEMENELRTLPADIDLAGNLAVDRYTNKTPKTKSSRSILPILGIAVAIFAVITIIVIVLYCYCCQPTTGGDIRRTDSDTSNIS